MLTFKKAASMLALLLATTFLTSCHDSPVSTEDTIDFPNDKVSIERPEFQADLAQLGRDFGVVTELGDATVTDGRPEREGKGEAEQANPVARANAVARRYLRILQSLELTDDQWINIRHCFADFKECAESTTERYRNARQELHQEFRANVERIKTAVANGDVLPERGRELYKEALAEYRAKVRRLTSAYHEAIANCLQNLRECIESALNERQLVRWLELLGRNDEGDGGGRDGTGTRG